MVRQFLIGVAASAGLATMVHAADLPAVEAPRIDEAHDLLNAGVADLWLGYMWFHHDEADSTQDDTPNDTGRIGGQLLYSIPFGQRYSFQLDVAGEGDFDNDNDNGPGNNQSDYEGLIQGGAHLSYRDPASHLFGIFAGVGQVYVRNDSDETGWMVGAEGQYYWDATTLYGQLGYYDVDADDSEPLGKAWFVRANVRHFISPNTMISVDGIAGRGEENGGDNDDIKFAGWEVLLKHQYGASRYSVFAAYDGLYMHVDEDGGESGVEHVAKIGVSIGLGEASDLLMQDRYGATVNLPTELLKTSGYTSDVID